MWHWIVALVEILWVLLLVFGMGALTGATLLAGGGAITDEGLQYYTALGMVLLGGLLAQLLAHDIQGLVAEIWNASRKGQR